MNTFKTLYTQSYPIFRKIQESITSTKSQNNIPTFLFKGNKNIGKEWATIKLLQSLNCVLFSQESHSFLLCPICSKINKLSLEYGILSILTSVNFTVLNYYTELLSRGSILDDLSKESYIHLLAKLNILLEIQFSKERNSSPSKKLGTKKLQEYRDIITATQSQILYNSPLNTSTLQEIFIDLQGLNIEPNIDYVKMLIEKIHIPNIHLKYKALIIKDAVDLRDQTLVMNTLLKLVEEPPKNTVIFFITEKYSQILPTIRSRVLSIHLRSLSLSYLELLSDIYPLYPTSFLYQKTPSSVSIKELLENPNTSEIQIIQYLEEYKIKFIGSSPLYIKKYEQINKIILGIREYRIPIRSVREIIEYL